MKKFGLLLLLLFVPVVSFGAPSIRMLGNKTAMTTTAASGSKITPVKATVSNEASNSTARLGSLRAKSKTNNLTTNNSLKGSRFPVITPASSYNSVAAPQISGGTYGGTASVPANVDVAAIVDAVTQNIANDYYNKTEVYNTNEFKEAVRAEIPEETDDPRIDAIRIGSRPSHSAELDPNYVYIWIEEN